MEVLQIRRVAKNVLNKQSRTADNGWFSSLGLGVGLTTLSVNIFIVTKCFKAPRTWADSLARSKFLKGKKMNREENSLMINFTVCIHHHHPRYRPLMACSDSEF
jgi:hypothetical protein